MKAAQKKIIADVVTMLGKLGFDDEAQKLTDLRDELEEAWGEKSERWQDGEAGQAAREEIDKIAHAVDAIDSLTEALNEAMNAAMNALEEIE